MLLLLNLLWLLLDKVHEFLFQCVLVLGEPVLLPGVVKDEWVEVMALHAAFEETDAGLVVRLLFEFQRSAVLHELLEFCWLSAAQVLEWRLNLLLLDGGVLLILASAWETLPWKGSLEHVEQYVSNTL